MRDPEGYVVLTQEQDRTWSDFERRRASCVSLESSFKIQPHAKD